MALQLHVAGPALALTRRLEPGEPALILGRDADCGICLPDPERQVSRRHLSVWNEDDRLHFHVLSVVNGVDTGAGELPPGARGVLAPGDALLFSAYRVSVQPVPAETAPSETSDPWAEFERQAAELLAPPDTLPMPEDDDPFGDWGFRSTFGPNAPGAGLGAEAAAPGRDLQPFLAGLGLDGGAQARLAPRELEALGRLARAVLQGLLPAFARAASAGQDALAEDATTADATTAPPEYALRQLLAELGVHAEEVLQAVREADPGGQRLAAAYARARGRPKGETGGRPGG